MMDVLLLFSDDTEKLLYLLGVDILEGQAINVQDVCSRHVKELMADEDAQHLLLLSKAQQRY